MDQLLIGNETEGDSPLYGLADEAAISEKAPKVLTKKGLIDDKDETSPSPLYEDHTLYWYLISQLVIASVVYLCCIYAGSHPRAEEDGQNSKRVQIIYLLVLLTACVIWLIVACMCYTHCADNDLKSSMMSSPEEFKDNAFKTETILCDMKIRQLGSIHRHTIQCMYTLNHGSKAVPHKGVTDYMYHIAAVGNVALGFTLFGLWLLHFAKNVVMKIPLKMKQNGQNIAEQEETMQVMEDV